VPYHRLVIEIFLVGMRFAEVAGRGVSRAYRERLRAMLAFVDAYVTPEGLSPVVGDADDGRALVLGATDVRDHRYLLSTGAVLFGDARWARRAGRLHEDSLWLLGPAAVERFDALAAGESSAPDGAGEVDGVRSFADAGFHILRTAEQYLFVDAGPVGFHGRGGHGHNDCLSFEWHALGRPLLTDSGAYVYTPSVEWRNRFRSTAFHNAIRVDGEEINRLPSALALWSLCDDARPINVASGRDEACLWLTAGHTGYRHLTDPVTVRRRFLLDHRRSALRIEDRIDGKATHELEVFFHAAPGAVPCDRGADGFELSWPDGTRASIRLAAGPPLRFELREGWFSPSYGVKVARPVWVASGRVATPAELVWGLRVQR